MRALLTHPPYIAVILIVLLYSLTFTQTNAQTIVPSVHTVHKHADTYDSSSMVMVKNTRTPERIAQATTPTPGTEIDPTPTPATEAERQRNEGRIRPDPLPVWMAGFGAVAIAAALFIAVQHNRRR